MNGWGEFQDLFLILGSTVLKSAPEDQSALRVYTRALYNYTTSLSCHLNFSSFKSSGLHQILAFPINAGWKTDMCNGPWELCNISFISVGLFTDLRLWFEDRSVIFSCRITFEAFWPVEFQKKDLKTLSHDLSWGHLWFSGIVFTVFCLEMFNLSDLHIKVFSSKFDN